MTTTQKNPLKLGERKKPTQKHRIAVWENMLGTVYAANSKGEVKYFDYDWDGAVAFADLGEDLRTWKCPHGGYFYPRGPRKGQFVLYTR